VRKIQEKEFESIEPNFSNISPSCQLILAFLVNSLCMHGEYGRVGEGLAAVVADVLMLRLLVHHLDVRLQFVPAGQLLTTLGTRL
jgi:hypothetical protein